VDFRIRSGGQEAADRKMADRKMADRKMADRKMADRKMAGRKIRDGPGYVLIFLSDIFLSAKISMEFR
jgi:hypothetical protein